MTNGEKYKTAQERTKACKEFMKDHKEYDEMPYIDAAFHWLDLECEEEKPLPCYMCGSNRITSYKAEVGYSLICRDCGYCAGTADTREEIEVKHNRVAKAVRESEAK